MHKILRAEPTPALLNHRRPSTFPATCLSCGRTLLVLLAALSAGLRSVFAAFQNPPLPHHGRKRAVFVFAAFLLLTGGNARAQVPVPVTAVPIVVESTTEEYFVLYVRHDLDGTEVEIPVLVKRGEAGTTTLAENVEALPAERYRVEKYLTELADLGRMNPVNRAGAIDIINGAVAIPDRETFETLSYQGEQVSIDRHLAGLQFVKFYLFHMNSDRPAVYFMNTVTHRAHYAFVNTVPFSHGNSMRGEIIYHPNVVAPDGSLGVYRYEFEPRDSYSFEDVAHSYEVLAASMPLLENNLAYYPMPARALPLYYEEQALYDDSRINVLFEEDILPDVDFISLNRGEGYGLLRKMSLEERPNPRNIVIY